MPSLKSFFCTTAIVCMVLVSTAYTHKSRREDTCSYSFQIWQPEQNIVDKLRMLEALCSNITSTVDYRLMSLRNQVITEVLNTQNVTHRLEKDLLEQKLKHVQQTVELKDLKLQLLDVSAEFRELRGIVEGLDDTLLVGAISRDHRPSANGAGSNYQVQRQENDVERTRGLLGQLKNNVGDLKAEWLLIKREVNEIKTENLQAKFHQDDLKADTITLKSLIESLKSQTGLMQNELNSLTVENESLRKSVNEREERWNEMDQSELMQVRSELADVRSRCDLLENELVRLGGINEELRHEALSVLAGKRNVTVENITRLLQKMAAETPQNTELTEGLLKKDHSPPKDCHDIYKSGKRVSGVYQIQPGAAAQRDNVYCEMVDGMGWTLLSRRQDGTIDFSKGWVEYQNGFGSLYGEFWLGNDNIHKLTYQKRYKLRVDIWDWEGGRSYAEYDQFSVTDSNDKYRINVASYSGNAGDSLSYHDKMAFSTVDSDNDLNMNNCAEDNKGGWWYNSCYSSNLNGLYHAGWYTKNTYSNGVTWYTLKESEFYSLRAVEMKIRPMYL